MFGHGPYQQMQLMHAGAAMTTCKTDSKHYMSEYGELGSGNAAIAGDAVRYASASHSQRCLQATS
eukprot:6283304-Prymnesium_polylepis.1